MTDDALTMRGPVHGTKGARKAAIDSSVGAVTETYDFIWFGTAAALYFGHALVPGASPIACTLASFATLGVWVNLDTFGNNAAIITINDLERERHGFSGLPATPVGGPSPNWRPDCQSPPYPAPRCWRAGTGRLATPTGKGGRRRSTDPQQHSPGPNVVTQGILRPAGAATRTRSRSRAAPPGPRHTDTAAPPCAATASPHTIGTEYIVNNRAVPS